VYTVFALYSPSHTLSPHPLPLVLNPSRQDLFNHPVLWFCKRKKMMFLSLEGSYTGSFLVTFPCTLVLEPKLVHLLHFSSFYLSSLMVTQQV
jgi:hypothetical protein